MYKLTDYGRSNKDGMRLRYQKLFIPENNPNV